MSESVEVAGLKIRYARSGTGPPLLLLHGAFGSSAEWDQVTPSLAKQFTVFATDTRGHGGTPDPGTVSYDLVATDVIGFIETIIEGPTSIVGWSDGGIVALLVALLRPDLVRKIVPVSANFHTNGLLPETRARFEGLTPDSTALEHFRSTYEAVSPDGAAHWPEIVDKVKATILSEPTLEAKELSGIEAPTLVLSGDDDIMSLEHTIEMMRAIPSAELAIVPGASHFLHDEKPEFTWTLIRDFLLNDPTPTMMPIRRTHG
jgi:pimeloyl-ACP methyl ester carboxylesterase